jgi:hypothetical protein
MNPNIPAYRESKTLLERNINTQWAVTNDGYNSPMLTDKINKSERKQQVAIFRQ